MSNKEKMMDVIHLKNGFQRNQSNVGSMIATAKTKMSAMELKTFYQVSTLISMDDSDLQTYTISVADFAKALNIGSTHRTQIITLCRRIVRQVFEIKQENGDWLAYTIFSRMHYKHKEQLIEMRFNQDFRPFLLELKQFTKIHQVKFLMSFASKYAIRFYVMLKDYRKLEYRDFKLEELFEIFELPKSYRNYANFYKFALSPAIREINERSDIVVEEPEIIEKQRKRIIAIRLRFQTIDWRYKADKVEENDGKLQIELRRVML